MYTSGRAVCECFAGGGRAVPATARFRLYLAEADLPDLDHLRAVRAGDFDGLNRPVEDDLVGARDDELCAELRLAALELGVVDDGAVAQVVFARDLPERRQGDPLLAAR